MRGGFGRTDTEEFSAVFLIPAGVDRNEGLPRVRQTFFVRALWRMTLMRAFSANRRRANR